MAIFEGIVDIRTLEVLLSVFLPPDGARQPDFPVREPDRDWTPDRRPDLD